MSTATNPSEELAAVLDGPDPATPKLVRYELNGYQSVGVVVGDEVSELTVDWHQAIGFLAGGTAAELPNYAFTDPIPLESVRLLAPITAGGEVFCIGLNYLAHQQEAAELVDAIREQPIVFSKFARALANPADDLVVSKGATTELDWEAELGVVIGRDCSNVSPEDAWKFVAGYTVVNDITGRDLQKTHQQWLLGKNLPASTPIGPWVVGREFLPTPPSVEVQCVVNGAEKQRSNTDKLIHSIPELVSLLSRVVGLSAGDVIATGTPEGVGFKRTPPEYLVDGDVVVAAVGGVGVLENTIRLTS